MKTLFILVSVMVVLFLVVPSKIEAQTQKPMAEIIVENANLRESANASSEIIREVTLGERLVMSASQPVGAWYKVFDAKTRREGWLHGNTFKISDANVKPRTEQSRPSSNTVPPPITALQVFYYRIANWGYARDSSYREYRDNVKTYGEEFDSDNYKRAMADEFERNRYRARIQAKIDEEVKKVNFSQKFSTIGYENLGEYSFGSHSFPIGSRSGVNGDQFALSLPMSEADANAFVKSRASQPGNINRTVKVRTIYSLVKGSSERFIYSVEVFADEEMTRKLGDIRRINWVPKTGEEWSLASTAAVIATKEIGRYAYMRVPDYAGGSEERFGRLLLTDVGFSLLDGLSFASTTRNGRTDCNFYGGQATGRTSRGKHSFRIMFDPAEWFFLRSPCALWIPFETEQERERFLADLTITLREWRTKYDGFQFAAGEYSIEGETRLYRFPPDGCVVVKVYAAPLFFYPKGGEVSITPPSPPKAWRDRPDVKTQLPSDLKTGDYKVCASDRDAWGIEVKN